MHGLVGHEGALLLCSGPSLGFLSLAQRTAQQPGAPGGVGVATTGSHMQGQQQGQLAFTRLRPGSDREGAGGGGSGGGGSGRLGGMLTGLALLPVSQLLVLATEDGTVELCR
jgi:hypothetical protein